jgi:hemerythrin superfamily protein
LNYLGLYCKFFRLSNRKSEEELIYDRFKNVKLEDDDPRVVDEMDINVSGGGPE